MNVKHYNSSYGLKFGQYISGRVVGVRERERNRSEKSKMSIKSNANLHQHITSMIQTVSTSSHSSSSSIWVFSNAQFSAKIGAESKSYGGLCLVSGKICRTAENQRRKYAIVASSNVGASFWEEWKPVKGSSAPALSDVLWPAAGAFAAMAILGKMDQILAPKGISMTIAPLGAVCAVLFATPSSPAARKYNIFIAQIGCAALGVVAFCLFGPGWLARSSALAASIAFMIYTGSNHPPAASLPLLFIDGAKLHPLNFWYALFPGAAACILLCLIQEMVVFLKKNMKF